MTRNSADGSAPWIDPDDPPELADGEIGEVEVFEGTNFVRRRGRPRAEAAREQISIRLDRQVLERLRAFGPGWQSQVNPMLREALRLDEPMDDPIAKLLQDLDRLREDVLDLRRHEGRAAGDSLIAGDPGPLPQRMRTTGEEGLAAVRVVEEITLRRSVPARDEGGLADRERVASVRRPPRWTRFSGRNSPPLPRHPKVPGV